MHPNGYKQIWQHWNLISPEMSQPQEEIDNNETCILSTKSCLQIRQSVQKARIKRRLSIAILSESIGCTVNTLTMFERGEGVLPCHVEQSLLKFLDIK